MRIAVLGTGTVGRTIGSRLVGLGHKVWLGSRSASSDAAAAWVSETGDGAHAATFADAAAQGEIVFNCTKGEHALDALRLAGADNLSGKTVVDVTNPLDFSQGMPPTLLVKDTDSLAEQIQREFADARVVKALNTMNANIMVHPDAVEGDHNAFIAGDDDGAKVEVRNLLESFGWASDAVVDLGPLQAARGLEMFLPLWLRIYQARGNANFNIAVVG